MNLFFLLAIPETPVEEINFGTLIVKMIFFLGLVVALIYLVLKKMLPFLLHGASFRGRSIKVLERLPLDQRRSLLIVEIQERIYLIGSAEGQINVLMELDREKMNAGQEPRITSSSGKFEEILKKAFQKKNA